MNPKKMISLIQLAIASGNTSKGDQLIGSIQSKKAKLVLFSSETGENRKKKIIDKCTTYNVDYLECDPSILDALSHRTIRSLAILDTGFASAIAKEGKG
jgi:ribosomal protein L7Ae-like RNA K-turn-binding protein